jgi:hypothetical protein
MYWVKGSSAVSIAGSTSFALRRGGVAKDVLRTIKGSRYRIYPGFSEFRFCILPDGVVLELVGNLHEGLD